MIYYAITVNAQNIVTGVHECLTPFSAKHFERSPDFASDRIIDIPNDITGIVGLPLAALNEDYTPKSLVWMIENGYAECPAGFELIDGELIEITAPIESQPQSIRQKIEDADARIAALEEELKKLKPTITTLALDVVGLKQIEKPTSIKSK